MSALGGVCSQGVCLLPGGVCSRGVCSRGVSALGVSAPGRGVSAQGGVCSQGGVSALGGVCSGGVSAPGGCLLQGVSAPGGCLLSHHALRQTPPPPCGQTDTCKNITFATSLRTVIIDITLDPLTYILENRREVQKEGLQLVLPVSATHISSGAPLRNGDSEGHEQVSSVTILRVCFNPTCSPSPIKHFKLSCPWVPCRTEEFLHLAHFLAVEVNFYCYLAKRLL